MNQAFVISLDVADDVIDTIAVEVSVLGVPGITKFAGVKFPGFGLELTVSE